MVAAIEQKTRGEVATTVIGAPLSNLRIGIRPVLSIRSLPSLTRLEAKPSRLGRIAARTIVRLDRLIMAMADDGWANPAVDVTVQVLDGQVVAHGSRRRIVPEA